MKSIFAILMLAALATAQISSPSGKVKSTRNPEPGQRGAFYASSSYEIIPHITKGANWTSKFVLFNVDTESKPYKMVFYNSEGKPTSIPLKDHGDTSEVAGFLQPGGSVWFQTQPDPSPNETQYWARLKEGSGSIQGIVIFSWSVPGNTPAEVTVPLSDYASFSPAYVPFNNTEGFKTALALTNTDNEYSFSSDETIVMEAINPEGIMFFSTEITLKPGHKTAFLLPDSYPQLQNQKGTIRIKPKDILARISFLALQFNPAGSVTLVLPFDEY